ncbi:MAG: FkbM family methyltransferase [Magnetococcales bacterium]|nr:FkbM family methyltransferase [Magnetococcales bacterium]
MKQNQRPISFVFAATDHGGLLVSRYDYRVTHAGTFGVGHQLLTTSSFDPLEVDIALQLLESRRHHCGDGVFALDCGANIGVHTIEWAKRMSGWGSVWGIEAQERIFYALAGNITINNCFNARAIWAAVGARKGVIGVPQMNYCEPASFGSLELRQNATPGFTGQHVDHSANLHQTEMIAIDDFSLTRIDLIKIDIEGMELEALDGAERTITGHKPILMIEKIKTNEKDLKEWVEQRGYTLFPVGLNIVAVHQSDPVLSDIRLV